MERDKWHFRKFSTDQKRSKSEQIPNNNVVYHVDELFGDQLEIASIDGALNASFIWWMCFARPNYVLSLGQNSFKLLATSFVFFKWSKWFLYYSLIWMKSDVTTICSPSPTIFLIFSVNNLKQWKKRSSIDLSLADMLISELCTDIHKISNVKSADQPSTITYTEKMSKKCVHILF